MSYLSFKKDQLINLEYSLAREFLGTNRGGGYCSSTLVFCNTRKYHGLLVVPIEKFRGKNYVMLSSLDETILQHGRDFNFGVHKYEGTYVHCRYFLRKSFYRYLPSGRSSAQKRNFNDA